MHGFTLDQSKWWQLTIRRHKSLGKGAKGPRGRAQLLGKPSSEWLKKKKGVTVNDRAWHKCIAKRWRR